MARVFRALILFFMVFGILNAAEIKSFKVSYDPDYAPFSYKENNEAQGFLVDIWKAWGKENRYKIEFVDGKFWDNALLLAKRSEVDFFLGTEVYEDWMKGSVPITRSENLFYTLQENNKEFSKLSGAKVGIIGSDYKELLKEEFPNFEIKIYDNYKAVFKDLFSKKIDLLFDDKPSIEFYILQNRILHKVRSLRLLNKEFKIQAISNNQKNIEIFNEGFKKLSKEQIAKIERKWYIRDALDKSANTLKLTKEEEEFLKSRTFNVSVSTNWKPFIFLSDNNEPAGLAAEYWDYISKKLDIKSKYYFQNSFSRQLEEIKNRSSDLIFSTGDIRERREYALFTKSYISFPISIATLKDENIIDDIKILYNKKIAVGRNYTAHKMLKKHYPGLELMLVDSIEQGLKYVNSKKVYAYVDVSPNLKYNINKLGLENIKISGNTGLTFDMKIMVRDDYPLLVSALNKAIDSVSGNELDQIALKWENVQFEKDYNTRLLIAFFLFFTTIIVVLAIRGLIVTNTNKKLKSAVETKTKELKQLNENLENMVQAQTKALRKSKELLDEAQQIAHIGSYYFDISSKKLIWSKEHFRVFDIKPFSVEPTLELYLSLIHPNDRQMVKEKLDIRVPEGQKLIFDYRLLFKEGSLKYVQSTMQVRYDKSNNASSIVGTIQDITGFKKLELEKIEKENLLTQQSKMAAMGEMLENIAHQWRQPLSIISSSASAVQLHKEFDSLSGEFLSQSMESIEKSAQYLSKTIDDFRNFFKQSKEPVDFPAKELFDKCIVIINSSIEKNNITLVKNIGDIHVKTLENELIQVLMNLFKNSIDALSEAEETEPYIFIEVKEDKHSVRIEFKDNGGGIPEKIIDRIFEPYFTTKHKSQGTGIGLYMSFEIITKHLKGSFTVENSSFIYNGRDCRGAKFTILLPKAL
jgi:signal transduction histidine kinase/ABC-type amino acid transport substrate-binding protein